MMGTGGSRMAAAILVVLALLLWSSADAVAIGDRGRLSGCRWRYTVNLSATAFRIEIRDTVRDGHGCSFSASVGEEDTDYRGAVFVEDGQRSTNALGASLKPGECLSLEVRAAAPRDRIASAPKVVAFRGCL